LRERLRASISTCIDLLSLVVSFEFLVGKGITPLRSAGLFLMVVSDQFSVGEEKGSGREPFRVRPSSRFSVVSLVARGNRIVFHGMDGSDFIVLICNG
jgi:hypothetical protein